MKKHLFMSLILLFTLGTSLLMAQDEEVVIKIDTLSTQVFMLTGQGGNIGIYVGLDYVFMIDDQFDRLSGKLKTAITSLTDKPIAFLFNTHMHGDHSGGNAKFNSDAVTLVAQDNVRNRIKSNQQKKLDEGEITTEYFSKMLPEVTFSEDITFYDGDETIMAFHVHNAHTDGDAMVYFTQNNVLHMGDTYFSERYPYIDLKSGGSIRGYIAAHKKALMIINEDTKIIPGHGRPSTFSELQSYVVMLEDIMENVQEQMAAGKTLEEVISDTSLTSKYDANRGDGFIKPERLRQTIYESLMGE
ncbi:MBL fold metallo-hydrolase [Aggregatimonas sangjinii]|uniref:MBL fold metallo-hydrolase n=1 Tax=Aggregatimonas sangjinii TaxID=2583587 RepID=A0A5B7SV84_9FLAO|nr:MBL fold metallo-hydrolase [Aggregatimonas sangjinii]QCX01199.1 MBL fold metallo-hydrolase [Aggregatimonas sangjinii]